MAIPAQNYAIAFQYIFYKEVMKVWGEVFTTQIVSSNTFPWLNDWYPKTQKFQLSVLTNTELIKFHRLSIKSISYGKFFQWLLQVNSALPPQKKNPLVRA